MKPVDVTKNVRRNRVLARGYRSLRKTHKAQIYDAAAKDFQRVETTLVSETDRVSSNAAGPQNKPVDPKMGSMSC
jgi:hypothetical protein